MTLTIKQIAEQTEFTEEELEQTLYLYGKMSPYIVNQWTIPEPHHTRYKYLWRNLTFRYSNQWSEYQLEEK